jgi:hypothetical protein
MSKRWFLAAALALAACGQAGVDDAPARRVGPDGDEVGTHTMDLRQAGQGYVFDVDQGSPDDDLGVVGGDGQRVPARDWLARTTEHLRLDLSNYTGAVSVFTGVDPLIDLSSYRERSSLLGTGATNHATCPPTCIHCPEQNLAFCASLCGL